MGLNVEQLSPIVLLPIVLLPIVLLPIVLLPIVLLLSMIALTRVRNNWGQLFYISENGYGKCTVAKSYGAQSGVPNQSCIS